MREGTPAGIPGWTRRLLRHQAFPVAPALPMGCATRYIQRSSSTGRVQRAGRDRTPRRYLRLRPEEEILPEQQATQARRSRHPSSDLQATDQVPLDSKAPLQLGGPTGEVAGEAASHEGALLAGALGADHLSGVLVFGRCPFLPAPNRGGALESLAFSDDHRIVGEQCHNSVDVATSVGLEVPSNDSSLRDGHRASFGSLVVGHEAVAHLHLSVARDRDTSSWYSSHHLIGCSSRSQHASCARHSVRKVPSSMMYSLPVIYEARSDTRTATSSATSSGRPGRPIGIPPGESMSP